VLAVVRARQVFGGTVGALPGLRAALAAHFGLDEQDLLAEPGAAVAAPEALTRLIDGPSRTGADLVDLLERLAKALVTGLSERDFAADVIPDVVLGVLGEGVPAGADVLAFACAEVVPRLAGTTDEITNML